MVVRGACGVSDRHASGLAPYGLTGGAPADRDAVRIATVTDCPAGSALEMRTLAPGKAFETEVAFEAKAGTHRLSAIYTGSPSPEGAFAGKVQSEAVEVKVAPPDPDHPVVELDLPQHIRAGRPFTVTVRHVNRGGRGWILYNEKCGGFPRDFVSVDGVETPIVPEAHCSDWDNRITLEPGHTFRSHLVLTLPAGQHTLQAKYRVGPEYEAAVVWKGEAVSAVATVEVKP